MCHSTVAVSDCQSEHSQRWLRFLIPSKAEGERPSPWGRMEDLRTRQVLPRFGARSLGRRSIYPIPPCLPHLCMRPSPPTQI